MEKRLTIHLSRNIFVHAFFLVSLLLFLSPGRTGAGSLIEPSGEVTHAAPKTLSAEQKSRIQEAYGRLPLYFVENRGQVNDSVKYYEKGVGHTAYFTWDGITFVNRDGVSAALTPVNGNGSAHIVASEPRTGKIHHFLGNDPGKWVKDVPTFGTLTYREIFLGVDLSFYGNNNRMEYDIIVKPGADPKSVKFEYAGIEDLSVNEKGNLLVRLAGGDTMEQEKPFIYQENENGERIPVEGSFEVLENKEGRFSYGFRLASYDPARPLVIDPAITYSSYLGGTGGELIYAIAADASGNAYVTGFTLSSDYPTTPNAASTSLHGDHDCFVTKIDSTGALAYSTYLGGSGYDTSFAIAVDASGNIFLGGATGSSDFPFTNTSAPANTSGAWTGFVAKINSSGSLAYSTRLGGTGEDEVHAVAVDAAGNAYVAGVTFSSDFPTLNPLPGQGNLHLGDCATYNYCMDGFVSRLDPSGTLVFSTYLGGSGEEQATSIAVDSSGSVYVAGITNSSDFPTKNPLPGQNAFHQDSCGAGACDDGFVVKIDSSGSLVYATYLGGSGEDGVAAIAVDASGNLYVAGNAGSSDFPTTPGAFSTTFSGGTTGFISKLNSSGSSLVYSTFLGGSGGSQISGMALDASGDVCVAGNTYSSDFPTTPDALPEGLGDYRAGFITKIDPAGSALIYSTYFGWEDDDDDMVTAMAADPSGNIYVAGYTYSSYFPITPNATFPVHGAEQNGNVSQAGFLTKVSPDVDLSIAQTVSPGVALVGDTLSFAITVSNAGPGGASGVKVSDNLPAGLSLISALSSQGTCTQSSGTITCDIGNLALGAGASVTVNATALQAGNLANTATVSGSEPDPNPNNNSATSTGNVITRKGDLTVNLLPASSSGAGAKWQVDSGEWQDSGTKVTLAAGTHTVGFKGIAGWNGPSGRQVNIVSQRSTTISAAYTIMPPVIGAFAMDGGAATTQSRSVNLTCTVSGGAASHYMISESASFSKATWEAYSAALPPYTISSKGNGTKTIYLKLKNDGGVSSPASASIVLAELPSVTSLKIDSGASSTLRATVSLNNIATASPTFYMASESPTFDGAQWQTYSTAPKFTLSSGHGVKSVYFQVKNDAGESAVISDSIMLK
jgi:uncharacterized repeat protein (TIGR01451 family)